MNLLRARYFGQSCAVVVVVFFSFYCFLSHVYVSM